MKNKKNWFLKLHWFSKIIIISYFLFVLAFFLIIGALTQPSNFNKLYAVDDRNYKEATIIDIQRKISRSKIANLERRELYILTQAEVRLKSGRIAKFEVKTVPYFNELPSYLKQHKQKLKIGKTIRVYELGHKRSQFKAHVILKQKTFPEIVKLAVGIFFIILPFVLLIIQKKFYPESLANKK